MKVLYATLLIGISFTFNACNPGKEAEGQEAAGNPIVGRWKLEKEEQKATREKGVEYADQPTFVILNVQKNGYFILYDTFIDPAWKKKGLPLISERSKGQWEMKGKELSLHHNSDDTSFTEIVQVTEIGNKTLVTKGRDAKSNVYKTYGK